MMNFVFFETQEWIFICLTGVQVFIIMNTIMNTGWGFKTAPLLKGYDF